MIIYPSALRASGINNAVSTYAGINNKTIYFLLLFVTMSYQIKKQIIRNYTVTGGNWQQYTITVYTRVTANGHRKTKEQK